MSKAFKIFILTWLLILSIISLIAFCRTYFIDAQTDFAYSGILIGTLAVLCTALIGWQIYSIIDFNKTREALEKREKELMAELDKQIRLVNSRIEDEKRSARLNTAFLGHLLLLVINKKSEKIVIEAFRRINQIDESTDLIRGMSYQALKGSLPQLLRLQEDFYRNLSQFEPQHFDCVCKMALEEYSLTQNQSDYHILELVEELKRRCYP